MLKKIVFVLIFFCCQTIKAQHINYAQQIIDTLTSSYFSGRGYVNKGDEKAAKYISKQFKALHLKKYSRNYFQKFSFPVNTFPGKTELIINKDTLIPGIDFIVDPASPAVNYNGEVHLINDSLFRSEKFIDNLFSGRYYNKAIFFNVTKTKEFSTVLNEIQSLKYKPALIIVLQKKLTWSVATYCNTIATVEINDSSYFQYPATIKIQLENKFVPIHKTNNVIGYVKGKTYPDSFLVFTAHYDHLGKMGAALFAGANDNASGIAMLLSLAKHYSLPQNKPDCSIVFMAFAGEETGLIGSKFYTEHPFFDLKQIKFLLNLDLMGTGEEGITVVNATEFTNDFALLEKINTEKKLIKDIKKRGKAANSDHYWFTEKKVPSFFIYANGKRMAYHDVYDISSTLPLTHFDQLCNLLIEFFNQQ